MMDIRIRSMEPADFEAVVALQPQCFPPPFPQDSFWDSEDLAIHHAKFPEGQFVAVVNDEVVGSSSSLILAEETWQSRIDWCQTVGDTSMDNHDPKGTTLFGADISVSPTVRRQGVGRQLYEARFDLAQRLGLRRFATVCRIPGLADFPELSPEEYSGRVAAGVINDRTMTPLLKMGLYYVGIAHEFLDDDESRDCGAVLERLMETH
jgi:ribosomal protein S18 acetylase RimI-like enzyme